jgi:hypothetical protein
MASLGGDKETKEQSDLQNKIVGYLMGELRQKHSGGIEFNDDLDHHIFHIVLY